MKLTRSLIMKISEMCFKAKTSVLQCTSVQSCGMRHFPSLYQQIWWTHHLILVVKQPAIHQDLGNPKLPEESRTWSYPLQESTRDHPSHFQTATGDLVEDCGERGNVVFFSEWHPQIVDVVQRELRYPSLYVEDNSDLFILLCSYIGLTDSMHQM